MSNSNKPAVRKARTRTFSTAVLAAALAAGVLASAGQPAAAAPQPVAFDTCPQGYVWREAVPGDHVCVYPVRRQQARDDNAAAPTRVNPSGLYGPDTCVQGYVWREAVGTDHVCVVPERRAQAWDDNAQAAGRVHEAWLDATSASATLQTSALKGLVSSKFSALAKAKDSRVGVYGGRETISIVSDTSDGFAGPRNRVVRIGIYGFVSLPAVPDPEFYVELDLRIRSVATGDGGADIAAGLTHWHIHTSGPGNGTLLEQLRSGITGAFAQPVSFAHIPSGADFMTAGVPLNASVELYFKNTAAGRIAAFIAQQKLNDL
ncbi:hypothetical protein [Streptomyces sp. NBC_01483]|uniref:hypothetical protein n=1 Tax=Streptomyces sp. NBC_01483 TaxID=2903883 RepID=UPI002E2F50B5|nr:hypothetical protein [Streptomyces sp. NBC_01483]